MSTENLKNEYWKNYETSYRGDCAEIQARTLVKRTGASLKEAKRVVNEILAESELARADMVAAFLFFSSWPDGFQTEILGNGEYLTNTHLSDPDAESEVIGIPEMLKIYDEFMDTEPEAITEWLTA